MGNRPLLKAIFFNRREIKITFQFLVSEDIFCPKHIYVYDGSLFRVQDGWPDAIMIQKGLEIVKRVLPDLISSWDMTGGVEVCLD